MALPKWTMPAVVAVVLAVTGGVAALLWWWVESQPWTDPAQKTTALLDVVKVASGVAVGGGGLFALYLAARRQRTQEKELAHTEEDAAARRVTDLYALSVEQLGSDKAPVRLGGLYALERLAQDNPSQRQTIVNVLCAYLRMPPASGPEGDLITRQEREVRVTAHRILAAHQRPDVAGYWPGLHLDLSGATLVDANFSDCELRDAKFTRTVFIGRSGFRDTRFRGLASFTEAEFRAPTSFFGASTPGIADMIMFDGVITSYPESDWPDAWVTDSVVFELEERSGQWWKVVRQGVSAG